MLIYTYNTYRFDRVDEYAPRHYSAQDERNAWLNLRIKKIIQISFRLSSRNSKAKEKKQVLKGMVLQRSALLRTLLCRIILDVFIINRHIR